MATAAVAPNVPLTNAQASKILRAKAITMVQNIYSATIAPASNPVISNLIPRNVGIIKKFVVEIAGTLTNGAGGTATLTDGGLANIIQNVTFYDLNNNLRINTNGLHLSLLANAKRRRPYAATSQWNTIYTTGGVNNVSQMLNVPPALWPVLSAPATIAASTAGTFRAVFEIPIAYSDDDLRGAIFANVINSTMNLQITFNQNAMVGAAPADYTTAVYQGSTGVFTSATVNVYQVYLDQIPTNPKTGQAILPQTDLSTVYELKSTNIGQVPTANQDLPIPFTNFRSFFSAFVIYNNNGAATGRLLGSDINYFSLTTANYTNIFKYDPLYAAMIARDIIGEDLPAGMYYFSFRRQPIWTTQYGNQQINLNPITVNAGAYVNVYWEDMALQNTLSGATSLPA